MSLIGDITELRTLWSKLGSLSIFIFILSIATSIISTFSMIENIAFEFSGALLKLVKNYRELTEPLQNLITIGYPSRSLSRGEADFIFIVTFFMFSTMRAVCLSEGRKAPWHVWTIPITIPLFVASIISTWWEIEMWGFSFQRIYNMGSILILMGGLYLCTAAVLFFQERERQIVFLNALLVFGSAIVISGLYEGIYRAIY